MNERALQALFRGILLAAGTTSPVGCAGYHYEPPTHVAHIHSIPPLLADRVRAAKDGPLDEDACREVCGGPGARGAVKDLQSCHVAMLRGPSSEEPVIACRFYTPGHMVRTNETGGRAPEGLAPRPHDPSESPLGRHFAEVAYLEEASVAAFRRLERELCAHGAPGALVRSARLSAEDEARHTRITRRLARRFGGRLVRPRTGNMGVRPLGDVARENMAHGAIGETFGALVNHHQASHAEDPEVRAAYRAIAPDETRHAALALAVHEWIAKRLSPAERASLKEQPDIVFAAMAAGARERSPSLVATAGVPDRLAAQRLLGELAFALRPHLVA